jgi:phosphatidylserine decarboxylase
MGRFLLGSTVVLLYPKDTIRFDASWAPAKPVRLGEAMAERS